MILRINFSFLFIFLTTLSLFGQINEDFTDGNFTSNPVWSGDDSEFEVDGSNTLHLNAPAATAESYISTVNTNINLTTWEFQVSLGFNPSSGNRAFVYLVSDAADLEGSLNGYFIMVGNTDDEISLYRQDGTSTTEILDGTDDIVNSGTVDVWIRVTRDNDGLWELFYDLTGTDTYTSEGTVTDDTYTSTSYFGFVCDYTSTRSTLFNFDDISVIASSQVDSVIVTSENSATVFFNQEVEETTSENTGNYSVDNSISLASATRDASNFDEVDLVFNENLTSLTYQLSTSGIQDEFSSTAQTTASTFDFDYLVMELDTAITLSDSTIQVTYNQYVDETTGTNTANYSIDNSIGNPASATIVENDSNKVILEISSNFLDAITYNLAISNVQNKNQNSTISDNQDFEYIEPLLIDTVIVNSSNELLVLFSKSLDQITAETVSNYTIDNSIGNPSTATLSNSDSVVLALSTELADNTYEISISDVEDSDNNSIEDASTFSFDYLPLELNSVTVNSDKEIELQFNQALDQTSSENLSNYTINFDIGNPDSLDFTAGNSNILLYFSGLVNNEYEITIENLSNEDENSEITSTTADFTNSVATNFKDIIINEVFPDPNPSVGLPSGEFVEIYNRTEDHISIEDFTLSGGTIDSAVIAPDSYIILTSSSESGDYAVYGDVVEVSSMPGLTNSGRLLTLQDQLGNDVDSINYTDDWYQDNAKSDGGYTLELINQDLACSDENNWIASNDSDGGTPGTANAVLDNTPDTSSPLIESVSASDTDQIQITFSEPMDEASLTSATYTISGFVITVNQVIESGFGGVILDLDMDLTSETTYELTVSGATDCSGNAIDGTAFEFYYDITHPQIQKVVINSLDQITAVFNEPLNESIAETESNYSVDNALGNPSSAILDNDDNTRVTLTFSSDLLAATTYDLSIDNLEDTLGNAITTTQNINFEYSQQIDSVIIIATTLVDIYFDEAIDSAAATVVSNYDIEDVGNPSQAIPDESVDSLVHLVLPTNLDDNSTLTLIIENLLDADSNDLVTPEFEFIYDTRAPSPESIVVNDSVTLTVSFSEELNAISSETLENYQLDNDAFPDSASLQAGSTEVILIFSEEFEEEVEQTLSISDIKDIYGNEMSSTRNLDFTFDELAPRIDTIQQFAEDSVMIQFVEYVDQTTAEDVTNFTFGGSVNPSEVSRYSLDSTIVFLKFASDLTESASLAIEIDNVADINGNSISDPVSTSINTLNPTIAEITPISLNEVRLTFSKVMDAGSVSAITNYLLDGSVNPTSVSTSDNQIIELTFSEELVDGTDYSLVLSDILDDSSNDLAENSFEFTFSDYLESLSILNEYTIQLVWEKEMGIPELTEFTLSNSGANPIAISRDSEDLNILQLLFADSLQENTADTLSWTGISDFNGLTIPNGYTTFFLDTNEPGIESIVSTYFNELSITFSEDVESTSALASNHYDLLTVGNPTSVETISSSQYLLIFEDSLVDATDYELVVDRVSDDSGNSIEDTVTFTFNAPYIPTSGDLIITEIMADPSPVIGLPEAEFIEIFNNSSEDINLRQITLSDDSDEINLPDSILTAGDYSIIIDDSQTDNFSGISLVAINDFPSLGNSEDSISLSVNDEVLETIKYSSDWYQDDSKDNGGYSLERINITPTCADEENWVASQNSSGGTPGVENSVFNNSPDNENPEVSSLSISASNQLTISFTESIDTSSIDNSDFTLPLSISDFDKYYDSLIINFTEDLDSSVLYTITIESILDCAGNTLETFNSEFAIGKTPEVGDLLITEIMADPTPAVGLPEVEFIEIFNNSASIINLNSVELSDATSTTELSEYLLESGEYLVLTSESNATSFDTVNVLGVSGFPSLGNSEDSLALSINSEVINTVVYNDTWYRDSEKDDGGYSLERINTEPTCNEELNWIASQNTNGGTPGSENSVFDNNPDSISPTVTEITASINSITIYFSEPVDTSSIQVSDIIISLSITGLEKSLDSLVVNLGESIIESELYDISVNDILDCAGNEIEMYESQFGIGKTPELGDLIITEVMPDPSPVIGLPEVEYVEVYNNSDDLLNLSEVSFGDASTTLYLPSYLLEANEYLILTSSSAISEFDTINVLGLSGFPSLTNSSDSTGISVSSVVLDYISYDLSWYQDSDKDDGGYSLERIAFTNNCDPASNWAASNSSTGGTPGYENSILNQNPDHDAPSIVGVSVIGQNTLIITFNESMDTTTFGTEDLVIEPTIGIVSTNWNDFSELEVSLSSSIESSVLYTLDITNINDCAGNAMNSYNSTIGIGQAPEPGDIIITEILADPTPIVGLPEAEFIEILNNSDKLLTLEGLNIEDLSGSSELQGIFMAPGEYLVLTSTANLFRFDAVENTVGVTGFPSLGNDTDIVKLTLDDVTIDSLTYERDWYRDTDKDDGGYSLELINPEAACSGPNNWIASINELGGTPGEQNSVFSTLPDTDSPIVSGFSFTANQITIEFNETMDLASLNGGTYGFIPSLEILEIVASNDQIIINFQEAISVGTLFELTIEDVTDCAGNLIVSTTLEFGIGNTPDFHDILITEIMADPEPPNDLPNAEYLEIFNSSNNLIELTGLELSDATETTTISGGILKPGEYAILTPNSSVSSFNTSIKVIGVSSWPSLGNSADEITISLNSEEIFYIAYEEFWYDEAVEGGVSLEMIDTSNPCGEDNNWTASISNSGGTPGEQNSTSASNPDLSEPSILGAFAIDNQNVLIQLNERIFIDENTTISISPEVGITNASLISTNEISLELATTLTPNIIYTVSLSNIDDCAGNSLSDNTATFVLPESADSLDIVINEILFNPRSTGVDFVEIYNRSNQFINLKNWQLGNNDFFIDLDADLISEGNLILDPDEYLVLTTDKDVIINEYPQAVAENIVQVNSLPTLSNDEGTVILIDSTNNIIDLVDYFEDYHYNLLEDVDGVSLERINSESSSNDGNNWRSASSTVGFATPGYENSQQFGNQQIDKAVQIEPEVFTPGEPSSGLPTFTTINYEFDAAGNFANVRIYNTNGQLVKVLANGELLSSNGFFRWDGTNNNGKIAEVGYYIVHFELFNADGSKKSFKKTVVVGRQF